MKKLSKILLTFAFVLMLAVPFALIGCGEAKINEGIEIHTSFKTEYDVGDELDLGEGKITYTDEKGTQTVVEITSSMISSFDTTSAGSKEMTVTYNDYTVLVPYTVYDVFDVEGGAIYVGQVPNNNENSYFVVKFNNSKTSFRVFYASNEEDIEIEHSTDTIASCTREKINHQWIYRGSWEGGQATITAINAKQVHIEVTESTQTISLNKDLTKYEEPENIEIGALYYCEVTTQDGFPENGFLVVSFNSNLSFKIGTVNNEQDITVATNHGPVNSCVIEKINNTWVYTATDGDTNYKVTALGNDQIRIQAINSTQNLSKVLTKYVAE